MAYPTASDIPINYLCIFPETGETLAAQLTDCYRQFAENTPQNQIRLKRSVLKQTIFISVADNTEYYQSKQKLLACAKDFFVELPPTTILAQSPENGSLAIEIIYLEGALYEDLTFKQNKGVSWLIFERGKTKMVFAAGLGSTKGSENFLLQGERAFSQVQHILAEEKMDFSDIVRQWNYIEHITETIDENHAPSQHYQMYVPNITEWPILKTDFRQLPASGWILAESS